MSKKNLTRIIAASLFAATSLLTNVKPAIADNSDSITINFEVKPIRALYLDEQGNITKILSNSDTPSFGSRIPQVFQGNAEIPMNNEVQEQYNLLLSKMDLSQPGVYEVTPDILQYSLSGTSSDLERAALNEFGEKNSPDTYANLTNEIKKLESELSSTTENSEVILTILGDSDGSVDFSTEIIK